MSYSKIEPIFCKKAFIGGIRDSKGELQDILQYRFLLKPSKDGMFTCIPKYYPESTGSWSRTMAEWDLLDVIDSEALILDLGTQRCILPTSEVWDEVREIIKSNV